MFEITTEHIGLLRDNDLLPDRYRAVYAGGSLVRGWGGAASDVDIFVVTDEPRSASDLVSFPVQLKPDLVPVRAVHLDGRRWDVEYWVQDQVDQLLDKVSWAEFETGKQIAQWISGHESDFLDKLASAASLEGADWLTEHRIRLDSSAYRTIVATFNLNYYDNYAEDVVGQLAVGDIDGAVLCAKSAFGYAMDALLATYGECGRGPKWRARRFQAAKPAETTFERYWSLETMRTFDPGDPAAWAREVLLFCRDLIAEVELS